MIAAPSYPLLLAAKEKQMRSSFKADRFEKASQTTGRVGRNRHDLRATLTREAKRYV